ncbi:hypothetical protein HKX48_009297 [Thoreauomyces humboldtii]|nr:hypothetical protein HKX48_009297 [Thoreauomyces humboldtii]
MTASTEDEQVLQANYLRFQRTLLSAVDGQMADLAARMREREHAANMTAEEKKAMGVELFKAKTEIGGLNNGLGKIRSILQYSEDSRKVLEADREAAEREIARMLEENKHLTHSLTTTRNNLDGSAVKLSQMNDVNAAYFSSIKIQRRIEEKLKKELELTEERRKAGETVIQDMEKAHEALIKSKKEMEDVLKGQRNETAMAQGAMNKMQREIKELTHGKRTLEKQWEDALAAMAKRDTAFQSVETAKEELAELLRGAENQARVLRLEKADAEKIARDKDLECAGLQATLTTLRSGLSSADAKGRDVRNELVEAQVAESLYRQELDKITKLHEISQVELQRKAQTVAELNARIEAMTEQFELRLKSETHAHVARKEEQVEARTSNEIRTAARAAEGLTVTLRHDNAELRLQLAAQSEEIRVLQIEKAALVDRYGAINNHYGKLYDESKHVMYALEKKEHDVNALKGALVESRHEDKTRAHQLELQSMQKELAQSKAANEALQSRWLQAHKAGLKRKEDHEKLLQENMFLQTQLGITDTIRSKSTTEIGDAKKEALEHKHEAARLHSEVKRLQPVLEEMKRKNTALERQLMDAKFSLEESGITQNTSTQMLKTEIRRLYVDRSDIRQARLADERAAHGLERKYVLAREMVDKLKAERADALRRCAELGLRVEELERREAARPKERFAQQQMPPKEKSAWASLVATPTGERESGPPPTALASAAPSAEPRARIHELPDLEAWRLKIETLTSERTYLKQENEMLQRRMDEQMDLVLEATIFLSLGEIRKVPLHCFRNSDQV